MLLLASLLVIGGAAGASMAVRPACERTVVTGSLTSDVDFLVTAAAVYETGMIYGNPLLAHVEGTVSGPGWYSIPLPGFRDEEHIRVRSADAPVTAFFVEDGNELTFDIVDDNATFPATVSIDYIAGTAWWSHRYELDLDRGDLSMVARIHWQAEALFRGVDLLLVSGEIHTSSSAADYAPTAAEGAPTWGFSVFDSARSSSGLSTFSVPSSQDAGIYVVHRAEHVDLPGAAGKDAKACREAGFSLRVYESPVNASEYVVAAFSGTNDRIDLTAPAGGVPKGVPSYLALSNEGEVPWVPGLVEVWEDKVLVGSDQLAYTAQGGEATIRTGTSFDIEASRTVETVNGTQYVNYTLGNNDAVEHRVRVVEYGHFKTVGSTAPFAPDGGALVASVQLSPNHAAVVGFRATA